MSKLDLHTTLAMRPLRGDELATVSGGITGDRGCIPPFGSGDPRLVGWLRLPALDHAGKRSAQLLPGGVNGRRASRSG